MSKFNEPQARCGTCAFASKIDNDLVCRFNPPAANVVIVDRNKARAITAWPTVIPDRDWCGHHGTRKTIQ